MNFGFNLFSISIVSGYFLAKRKLVLSVSFFGGSLFYLLTLVTFYRYFRRLATFEGSFSFRNFTVIRQKSLKHSLFGDS